MNPDVDTAFTYEDVHRLLKEERGLASTHSCSHCGVVARDWSYAHNGDPELVDGRGRVYSTDLYACYDPLCRGCHSIRDNRQRWATRREEMLRNAQQALVLAREAARAKPDYLDSVSRAGKAGGEALAIARRLDPALDERLRSQSQTNLAGAGHKLHQRWLTDPDFAARLSAARSRSVAKTNRRRRSCSVCGLTSTPGGVGKHQSSSGHRGVYEEETP